MQKNTWLTTAAAAAILTAVALPAAAQTPQSAGETAPIVDPSQRGVLVFTPDFFTDQRPNTALDMVERVPGFRLENGDGGRGFEGAVGNTLINGARPASKNDTGSNALFRVPASQVERIELIRGGAPGIDMQGYPVVVNVILKSQSSVEHSLQTDAYLFEGSGQNLYGARYQFTARDGERTWSIVVADGVGTSDSNGPGIVTTRDGSGALLSTEDYVNDQYGGGTAARINYASPFLGGKIDATARYGVDDWNSYDRFTTASSERLSTYGDDSEDFELGVTYTRPLSDTLTLEARLIHEAGNSDSVSTYVETSGGVVGPESRFVSVADESETILRGLLRWQRSETLSFEGGGEVAYNMLDAVQTLSNGGVVVPLPSDEILVEETRGEIFGKATWRVRPDLSLEGGLRLEASTISQSGDTDSERTFYFVKPRFQATWTPWADNQFRFRLEREVGQLNFGDFAASAELTQDQVLGGNVNLEPEDRWIAEVAYERRFLGEGIFSIAYRHDEISNAIDRIPLAGGLSAIGNIGDGTLDRLSVSFILPTDRFGIPGGRLGFRNDWNHTEVTDPTTGQTRSISGIRPSQPNISFSQDIVSWKLNWEVAYLPMLEQYTHSPDQTFGFEGSDYFQAVVEYKPTDTITLRAQLNVWDDFTVYRTAYADRSAARPVALVETRNINPREFLSLQLRKTF
jgi:outer membrane cobalamin receptor